MKKILVLILMALVVNVVAFAQNYQEVVYLKNGSVIRGVIVEQIPSVSLKIQTADGSIFAYQMDEVEKITKELAPPSSNQESSEVKEHISYAETGYKMKKGYRGFIDLGYSYGVGKWGEYRAEFSTIHGGQIIPCLFVGVGVGFYYHWRDPNDKLDDHYMAIPFFADIRGTIPCRSNCQPFIDFRIGYTFDMGFYMSPSIGCRFAVSRLCGISLSVGYSMQKDYYGPMHSVVNDGAVTFKLGFDF